MSNAHTRRQRVTVSLPRELVARIDAQSKVSRMSRSGLVESWLRAGERQGAVAKVAEEVAAYYSSLTPQEAEQDRNIAHATTRVVRELDYDDVPSRRPRGRRR